MKYGPLYCEHANENPAVCRCPADCYCKQHTCKNRHPSKCEQPDIINNIKASRAKTKSEVVNEFLDKLDSLVLDWKNNGSTDKLEGLVHSILCIFDGCTGMPAIDLKVTPHPEDQQYHKDNGENWYPNIIINDDIHLHELFIRKERL